MTHISGDQGHYPRKTKRIKIKKKKSALEIAKETAGVFAGKDKGKVDRGQQFANYLATIDRLAFQNFRLRGRVREGPLTAKAGSAGGVKVTKMSTILDNYHDKALRLAQAKYYQKSVG